jgi:hypothetical protein
MVNAENCDVEATLNIHVLLWLPYNISLFVSGYQGYCYYYYYHHNHLHHY